jgi:1-aminocyclopropane-1-carboxylate deaminase
VLAGAVADGMRLHYLDRATYRLKDDPAVVADLGARLGEFYVVPEGGTTVHALRGCAETVEEIREPFDVIVTATGTGGTLAGLAAGLDTRQRAVGISVLKGATDLDGTVAELHNAGLDGSSGTGRSITGSTMVDSCAAHPSSTGSYWGSPIATGGRPTTSMSARCCSRCTP